MEKKIISRSAIAKIAPAVLLVAALSVALLFIHNARSSAISKRDDTMSFVQVSNSLFAEESKYISAEVDPDEYMCLLWLEPGSDVYVCIVTEVLEDSTISVCPIICDERADMMATILDGIEVDRDEYCDRLADVIVAMFEIYGESNADYAFQPEYI
ncbi:MAG: hypothetical protein MJ155_02025 [Candidatus Saccharibacteria bacterium]|nr:hypothetical protein [Candidatus Saccharibacteria bacterium]